MKKLVLLLNLAALSAFAGCEMAGNSNNGNARNTNSNMNRMSSTPVPAATPSASNSNISREEYDKRRADYEKDKGSSTIGQGVNDSWIWFKTKTALAAADDLRDSTINVDVVNDVITLKGTVETATQKTAAEAVAKSIEGQKGVKNQLTVKANDSMTNQMVNGNTKGVSNTNKK